MLRLRITVLLLVGSVLTAADWNETVWKEWIGEISRLPSCGSSGNVLDGSRTTNICATVCLSVPSNKAPPHTSAEPRASRRNMGRTGEENEMWGNPCDDSAKVIGIPLDYTSEVAFKVGVQAKNALSKVEAYIDFFTNSHAYQDFSSLFSQWSTYVWMESWLNSGWLENAYELKTIVPPYKVYGTKLNDAQLIDVMTNLDEHLPYLYKGMKMTLAGTHAVSKVFPKNKEGVKPSLSFEGDIKSVLCYFHEYMKSRGLEILQLMDSELLDVQSTNSEQITFLMFRDTLNYLEYISQIFMAILDIK